MDSYPSWEFRSAGFPAIPMSYRGVRCSVSARALAAHPRYIIADEISTMLDAVTQAQLWHFLLGVCQEQSIGLVFVSHSPSLVQRVATRMVQLDPSS